MPSSARARPAGKVEVVQDASDAGQLAADIMAGDSDRVLVQVSLAAGTPRAVVVANRLDRGVEGIDDSHLGDQATGDGWLSGMIAEAGATEVIVQEEAVSHALRARAEHDTSNPKGAARLASRLERLAEQHGVRISLVHPSVAGARDALAVVEQPPAGQHVVSDYLVRGVVRCIEPPELHSIPRLLEVMRAGGGDWSGRTARGGRVVMIDALGHDRLRAQVHQVGSSHTREEVWSMRDGTYAQHFVDRVLAELDGPLGPAALVLVDRTAWPGRLDPKRLAKAHNVAVGVLCPSQAAGVYG